jgi:anti-anti-sigma factor
MAASAFSAVELHGVSYVVKVLCDKLGSRESEILQQEMASLLKQHGYRVALDCSGVTLIASMGLGMFIQLNKDCRTHAGKFVIFGLNTELMKLLAMTKLEKVLSVAPDRAAALKVLAG